MKRLLVLLAATSLVLALSACGSSGNAADACQASRACPSTDGSYAWQPLSGAPSLVCGDPGNVDQLVYTEFLDYQRHIYVCKVPAPAARQRVGGVSFIGPTTVAAGPVPLKEDQLRFTVFAHAVEPVRLTVYWGDGKHSQYTVTTDQTLNLVHSYPRSSTNYFLAYLTRNGEYLGAAGEGPFRGPPPGPRTRYCSDVTDGKGGTLSATTSLPCAEAKRLFSSMSPHGKVDGYHCTTKSLPPSWSDSAVTTCTSGSRAFAFTSNP